MGRKKTNPVHEYVDYDDASGTSRCLIEGCDVVLKGNHSSNLMRHFAVYHPVTYEAISEKNKLNRSLEECTEPQASKPKKIRLDNFGTLKQCCIDLVKVHGRPLSLFDDEAFREMIALIPIATAERHRISSKNVARYIKEDEEKRISDRQKTKPNGLDKTNIKYEDVQCSCAAATDESQSVTTHAPDCGLAVNQPYWNYFEVSVDVATCSLCKENINWTNISELKEHLNTKHPGSLFKDDDEQFEDRSSIAESSNASNEIIEEIYVQENILSSNILGKQTRKSIPVSTSSINASKIDLSVEWCKGLDRFGLYVSALMKFLPKEKCVKFQSQIVQRLLQEQTSAA